MNNHSDTYNQLMSRADQLQDEATALILKAEILRSNELIDKAEWYRMLGESNGLQERYVELRDQAILADRIFWSRYQAEVMDNVFDQNELHQMESELRNG